MPTQYIEPEVAFQVTTQTGGTWFIYHTYKNNDFEQGRVSFWYTTDPDESEEYEFDMRAAGNADRLILQMALDRGLVAFNDTGELVFNQAHVRSHA